MIRTFSMLLLISAVSLNLSAQWHLRNPFPTMNTIYSISSPNDSCFFIGGSLGEYFFTNDEGKSWKIDNMDNMVVKPENIEAIHFFDTNNGLMFVGSHDWDLYYKRGIFKTTNGGSDWSKISDQVVGKFYFVNSEVGWATAMLSDGLIKTTDGGTTWRTLTIPSDLDHVTSIDFIDENTGWVGAYWSDSDVNLYKTTDGGISWRPAVESSDYMFFVNHIDFINKNRGWVATGNGIFRTVDGGVTWNAFRFESGSYFTLIKAVDENLVFAADLDTLYRSTDGGEHWESSYNESVLDMHFKDKNTGYIVGGRDYFYLNVGYKIMKTTDGGLTWNWFSKQAAEQNLNSVDFVDDHTAFVVGNNGTILKSTDDGINWSKQNCIFNDHLNDIKFIDGIGYIAGDSSLVLKTTDAGINWNPIGIGSQTSDMKSISFYNEINGVIAGHDGIIYSTSDGGNSWNSLRISDNESLNTVFYLNGNNLWAGGDSGAVWKIANGEVKNKTRLAPVVNANNKVQVYSIQFFNDKTGLAVCGEGKLFGKYDFIHLYGLIYKTTDGGLTWELKKFTEYTDMPYHDHVTSLYIQDESNTFAVTQSGLIFKSTDLGENWGQLNSIKRKVSFNKIKFRKDFGIIVGDEGLIISTNNGGGEIIDDGIDVTSVNGNTVTDQKFQLSQNYPNPFNPVTAIRYQIPEAGFVSLKVFDMLGKEVASLVNEEKAAGEYISEFNASNLSSGVYLYRLQAGGFVQTKKLMLMK